MLALSVFCGAVAGWAAIVLASRARIDCDAGWDAGGRFEMNFLFMLLEPACMGLAALTCRLTRPLPNWLRALAVVLILATVVVWFFAVKGTLDGYPSPGTCGPDNVPPWWPAWVPA